MLNQLVGISAAERGKSYRYIGLFNHAWYEPGTITKITSLPLAQVKEIAGECWHPTLGE